MSKDVDWGDERTVSRFRDPFRNIENMCPDLDEYLRPGLKVLDVGCGAGPITVEIATKVKPGSVVGLDASEEMIENARALADEAEADNVEFVVGDACSLDPGDDTFDIAFSVNLLGWLNEPVKALREQVRVTRHRGWVIIAGTEIWETAVYYPLARRSRPSLLPSGISGGHVWNREALATNLGQRNWPTCGKQACNRSS